jgi:hypothetical protein
MKKLPLIFFVLTSVLAKGQAWLTIGAGPQTLSPKRDALNNPISNGPIHPKKGVAFTIEPEWWVGKFLTMGLTFSHAQFGFEKNYNSTVSQAMLNFKIPISIKRFQPFVGFGAGYLNQTVNGTYDRYGERTPAFVFDHYVTLSPYAGLSFIAFQKLKITANYRYNTGIYSRNGLAFTPISSGFNIGLTIFLRPRYQKA